MTESTPKPQPMLVGRQHKLESLWHLLEVYYLAPGRLPLFEEDSEVVEFSPRGEYQQTVEVAERNPAAMRESA
jgi:hypothetical protein